MAEYNPSKIIKDGNTYNFRDTTKIPLAGSNEISGSLVPSTDGTVNLGSSTAQWDNAYIKSLTINGVACGNILTHNASEFVLVNDLSTVATSGSYDDLSNKPATMTPTSHTHGNITNDGKIGSNANKPLITTTNGTVTTGSFGTTANTFCEGNDSRLSDARTPTAHTHSASDITSGLATVATSGSYNDLSNKPTISTVNNGTLTIQQNGTNVQTFTANASTNKTANIQCVDLSTAQTISGVKTFSDGLFASKSGQGDLATLEDSSINSANEDANGMPLTGHTNSVKIKGSQFNVVPCMLTGQLYTSGDTSAELRAYKYKDLTANAIIALRYVYANNSGFVQLKNISSIIPNVTSTANFGSASLQWNTTYTRNILIDNDINIASSLINKTSTSGVLTIRGGINDTEGASLSLYGKDYGGSPGLIGNIYMTAYGNSDYTNFRIYPNGIIRVYNNSTATTKNVAMQEDTVNLTGNQTIGGVKTFTSNMVIQGSRKVTCNLDNSFIELDGGTTWGKGGSIVLSGQDRSSYTNSVLIVSKSDTNTDILQYQNGELKPHPNNTNNSSLGTSTSKWKSFNGIAPDELGLPTSAYTDVSSYITNFDSTPNTFTAPVSGFLNVATDYAEDIACSVFNVTTGIQVGDNNTSGQVRLLLPLKQGDNITVYINKSGLSLARIYHLKGKV